jgi:hypothetical protein
MCIVQRYAHLLGLAGGQLPSGGARVGEQKFSFGCSAQCSQAQLLLCVGTLLSCRTEHLDPMAVLQDLREANDHTMINEYFDAIEKLVTLVMEGHGQQAKDEGLCDAVLQLQEVSVTVALHGLHADRRAGDIAGQATVPASGGCLGGMECDSDTTCLL